jgi:hypothetical protein
VLRKLIIVLIALTLGAAAVLFWQYYSARRAASAGFVTQFSAMEEKLHGYFGPVVRHLRKAGSWGRQGILDSKNEVELSAKFIPVLAQVSQIHSIAIAGNGALKYTLVRGTDFWNVRVGNPSGAGGAPARWKRIDPTGRVTDTWGDDQRINPLSLTWYVGATAGFENDVYWTEPYPLLAGAEPGLTAAVGWRQDGRAYAVAFDLLMRDIARLTAEVRRGTALRCFLYSDRGIRIDLTRLGPEALETAQAAKSLGVNMPEDPVLNAALDARGRAPKAVESVAFKLNGVRWWARFSDFDEGRNRDGLAIVVPERELRAAFHLERYRLALAAVLACWFGLIVYARIRRRDRSTADTQT